MLDKNIDEKLGKLQNTETLAIKGFLYFRCELDIGDALTNLGRTTPTSAREIVFIDAGVENSQQILSGVNPLAEVIYLKSNENGVEQISRVLRERQNIATIHIVSHGDEAKLQLGTTSLSSQNLKQYAKQIRGWGDALTDTADILVYGCDVAAGNDGKKFVTQLSRLTGADVAASDNLTGASNLGGDWELEYTTGSIEATTLTSDYHQVLFTPTTIQELYNAWRSNTLPDLSSIQLKLDSNSVLNGTVTIASNDSNLLKLTGTNLSSSIGTGLSTANSSDDKGFNFTNATLNLSLNADSTYTYSLSGQAALNNFAELTLSADNITATGTQDGTTVNLTNFQLDVGNVTRLSGSTLAYNAQNEQLNFAATNTSAFIGHGANTLDTNDNTGLTISNATFNLSATSGQGYTYEVSSGLVSLTGSSTLSFSATDVTATGNASNTTVTLNNYALKVDDVASVSGTTLEFSAKQGANGLSLTLAGENVNGFIGYGAATNDTADDVGVAVSDVGFSLTLNSDKTFSYKLNRTTTSNLEFRNLPPAVMAIAGGAGALLWAASGGNDEQTFTFDDVNLTLADNARLSGDFKLQVSKGANGLSLTLAGENVNGFIGYGAATNDTADDVGVAVSDVGFSLTLNSDKTFSYKLNRTTTSNLEFRNLPPAVMAIAGGAGALLWAASGGNDEQTFTFDDVNLTLADNARLSGDFKLQVSKGANGLSLTLAGENVNGFIGYGAATNDTADDVGVAVSDTDFDLLLKSDKTYSYKLDNASAGLVGVTGLTLSAKNISATGDETSTSVTIGQFDFVAGSAASLSGSALTFKKDATNISFSGSNISALVGNGADTPDNGKDDIGVKLSNANFSLTVNTDNTYNYTIDNAQVALIGIDLFKFSGTASGKGDRNNFSLQLNELNLSISDYASLTGNFSFKVSSTDGTQIIELGSVNASAFVGIGASTPTEADDVRLKLSNVNSTVQIRKSPQGQSAYAYSMSGDVALDGINGLSLGGHVSAQMNKTGVNVILGGVMIATGVNQVSGTGLNLSIADLTTLTGDLTFNIRESDGAMLAAGKNLSATVNLADGLSGSLSDGTLGLVMYGGGLYALQGSGKANLALGADLQFTGDLGIEVNRTGKVVDEKIQIGNQTVAVNFVSASNITRFNASNLDMILTQSIKDALISGADKLIDLKASLVPKYEKDGTLISESLLSKSLPGTNATIDSILGISTYLSLGDSIKGYISPTTVNQTTPQTLQGLIKQLRNVWLPTLPIAKGLDFVIGQSGFSLSYASDSEFKRNIGLSLDQEANLFGLELEGQANIEFGVKLGIDFDLSFDWKTFTSKFDLNKLSFKATAEAKDIVLGGYFGPVGLSIGSNEIGKEKGTATLSLGGGISYVNSEFKVTTNDNRIDVVLPVYATLAGNDLSGGAAPAKAYLEGQLFGGTGVKFRHENFDKLLNFRNFGIGDVLVMFKDLVGWAQQYREYDIMQTEIPFVDLSLGSVLDFATAINDKVLSKIDFYRPRVDLMSGIGASITGGKLTASGANFGSNLAGKFVTINDASYQVKSVENNTTLVIDAASDISIASKDFVVHEKRQLLRTYQELIVAINNSGILPLSVPLSYDPIKNELVIPFSFRKDLPVLNDQQLNLGLDLGGVASLSTNAKTSINAGVDGRMDFVINFGNTPGSKGVNLYIDNVELNGRASLEVKDLEVAAKLGFVGLKAGGIGTDSGVRMAATVSTGLDRDPNTVTPGDRRFSFSDLMSGDLLKSFYFKLDGDAQAKLKGLKVNGGFGDISIAPNAELSLYVPTLTKFKSGVQTVNQPVTQAFDLNAAIASGKVKNEGIIVVMPDVSDLLSLKNLNFETVIKGVRAGIDFMSDSLANESFYSTPIPVINRSLSETFTFLDSLAAKLEIAAKNSAGLVQEVENTIESALGISDDNTLAADQQKFSLSLSNGALNIHFNWEALFSDKFDFNLDLDTFKQLSGSAGAAALDAIDALADLKGGGKLTLEATAKLNFDIGVDLDSILKLKPKIFLRDYNAQTGKGTYAQIGARLVGTGLDLDFKAGPINIGINNGTVVLDADGKADTKDYAGLLVAIDQKAGTLTDDGLFYIGQESFKDNLQVKLQGGFDINLPVRIEIAGLDSKLSPIQVKTNPVYGDQGLTQLFKHLAKSADKGQQDPLIMSFPDIRGEFEKLGGKFSLLGLINDPSFILDSVDTAVGTLEDVLSSNLAQDIPLIGDKLGDAASFLRDMRLGILGDLRRKLSGNGKAIEFIRETLYNILGPDKLNILLDTNKDNRISVDDVMVGWYDKLGNLMQNWMVGGALPTGADAIQFDMDLGGNLVGTGMNLPLDFSIPGFSLDINGGFALDIGWKFDFGFGFSLQDSFYLATNKDGSKPELEVGIKAYLDGSPNDPKVITPFSGEGNLLFFKAKMKDNNPGGKASGIYGGLSLDLKGDSRGRMALGRILSGRTKDLFGVSFGVDTKLDIGMTLEIDGAKGLPKIGADLVFNWSWQLGQKMMAPSFGLRDMRIDMGSFVSDFLTPIAEKVRDALQPMKPLIDVLDKKIDGLDKIIPDDPTLKGLVNKIMVLKGRKPIDWSFITEAKQMLGLVDQIASLKTGEWLPLGSIMGLGTNKVETVAATNVPQSTEVDKFLAANTRQAGSVNSSSGTSKTPRSGFRIMEYIKDISNWKNILTGESATLFTYELPLLEFSADFDALLAVIPLAPTPATVNISAKGSFSAKADLGFGYDTSGIQKAIKSKNPLDAFDGFFLTDFTIPTQKGVKPQEKDEFTVEAYLGLEAALALGIIEAGVGGGIKVKMGVDLQDISKPTLTKDELGFVTNQTWQSDGKIHPSEIATMFSYDPNNDGQAGGIKNLANVKTEVNLLINAFVDLNLFVSKTRILDINLIDANLLTLEYKAPNVQPYLGKVENGVLYLNSGSRSSFRKYGDITDRSETFTLYGQGNKVSVEFEDYYQTFEGVTKVVADGGAGDDTFDASRLFDIGVEFTGGAGKDKLILGTGGGIADGGDGDDVLDASVSWLLDTKDTRYTNYRNTFKGATLIGGAGRDKLIGSIANDVLRGGIGIDNLSGGGGNDIYLFEDDFGLDRINDSEGNNTLDFSLATKQLNATVNARGFAVTQGEGNEIKGNLTFNRLVMGGGNDLVNITDFGDRTIFIDDKGGNDTYFVRLGRATGSGADGIINLNDTVGDFDEVIAEQMMKDAIALNQNQLRNGREILNYTSGLDRLTLIGRAGKVEGINILDFGSNVTLNNTDNNGVSRNGTTDVRVVASQASFQSQINADAIIVETLNNITVSKTLNAVQNGYVDLRTYGDKSNILLESNIKVSTGDSEDGKGSGWVRLIAADGAIINSNASSIIGSDSHLILKAKNGIGSDKAALLTEVGTLTAATSLHGTGNIVIEEADSLKLTNLEKTATVVNAGLTIPQVSVTPTWMQNNQWVTQLSNDWRSLITDGNEQYAIANGSGNAYITLLAQDSLLTLLSGSITGRKAGANIVLSADDINFRTGANQVNGIGNLTLQANQLAWTYSLGAAAENSAGADLNDVGINNPNVMELSSLDLAAIAGDFDTVTIGRTNTGNKMTIGDVMYGTTGKMVATPRNPQAYQPEFRNTTILKTDHLDVRGDVRAPGEILTIEARTAQINKQNIHNPNGKPDSGITAGNLVMNLTEQMVVSGWLRGTQNVTINIQGSTGTNTLVTYEDGINSLKTDIGSDITVLQSGSLAKIKTSGSIKIAGLVEAKGVNSGIDIWADTMTQVMEGGVIAAREDYGNIKVSAGEVVIIESGGAVTAGARFDDINGKPTAVKTGEGADATIISPHELVIKGTVTTSDQMKLSAGSPLNHYKNDYFSKLPKDGKGKDHYLTAIGEDQFGMLITGTLTSLADDTTLKLVASDDIIIRGNIDVLGHNSDLKISTPTWVYLETFLNVQDNITIEGGFDADGKSTNGANTEGSSVYVHGTARINTKQAGSSINIRGAQDVDILGAVVAGGTIGATGVTWAGNDSTVTVTAGQQIFLDTGLLASKSVTMNGGIAGADDNGIGLLVTTAGGATAMGLTSDGSGALIAMKNAGNMEMMGTLVSGGKLVQVFDNNGNLLSQTIDWSGNYGEINIQSAGQAFIGGHTVNKQGEPIETGGYLFANDLIKVTGGAHSSGTGAYIQAASELVTHAANSSIEINAAQDADVQGLLVPGGEVTTVRDSKGSYMGRYVSDFGGESTIKITAENQVRIGQTLRAGKRIDLIGGIDPVEPGVNHSGKGMVLYGSTQISTWGKDSQINLNAPGRIDILAPAHTNEIEAAGFYEFATGVLSQDVTLKLRLDKVGYKIEATVTLPASATANNTQVGNLVADLNDAIKNATWKVVSSQDTTTRPIGSTYNGFDEFDMSVEIREGRLMLTSSYEITFLKNGSTNANKLGFTNLTTDLTSTLPYTIKADKVGSVVTIGSPNGPNGKLYIAGKILGYKAINLNSGKSPDGIDIDLDGTGLLETRDGSIQMNVGTYGIVKGDIIAGGAGSDIILTAENTLELHGSLTANDEVRLSAGANIVAGKTSIHTFGTSKINGRLVNIAGLNDVIIDSTIGEGSVGMTNLNIAATYGNLTLARTSGRIITDADVTMTGKNVSIEGVLRNTAGDANANTTEILIAATNNATLMTDIISQGTVKIAAGNNIEAYNGQILVQGTGEVLNISQTNANGNIKFGRTILVDGQYQQQGLDLASVSNVTINGTGTVNIGSGVRVMSSADNSTVNVTGDVINVTGSLLAGAALNNNTVTWTGKTATVNLSATDVVTFGGAGVENGKMVTRGGSAWATGNVNINIAGGANLLDFTMNDLSSIKSDATARFAETGTSIFADITDSKINITAQGQVEIDGLIQAYDDNADITIDSAGLLLINGYLKAEDTLTVDGGTNAQGYGLMLTPLIYRDPQGRLIDSFSLYINSNGEYVDANGVKLAVNAAPVSSSELPAKLTRISGGTLETAFGGNINISAEAGIVLSGQVAPSNGTTVNPEKISIISENNAGDVFIDKAIGARSQIIVKGKNLYLLDYQETDLLKSVRPNNALIKTYGGAITTDPSIQIHGTGKVIIAKSQAPLIPPSALVDSYKDIEVIADSLWVQGYLDSNTDVTLNVVTSAEINGLVTAAQNINVRAGINPNWDLSTLRGTVTRSQLSGGNILINGTGTLKANNIATLLAGGTVTISADSALGAGTKPVPIPFITQKAITVPVVTGTKQVSDGTIQVEVVNWIPTTVTEQVGVDQVRVGNEFFTMDVNLSQDSYWNPKTNTEREWFVNKVDYNTSAITSWSATKYSTSNKWAYTDAQGKKVETDIANPNHSFNELNDNQKNVVLEYLGYYKLYDFGYSNAKVDRTVNGNPTRTDVYWNLTETTESYKDDSVNGQTYRKEFIGGEDYKQAGFINTIDYDVNQVNWGSAGKPLSDHVFADLTAAQKDKVAIYKGYSNYQAYLNTLANGGLYNSYDVATNPNNIATTIIKIDVDGWNDKYIRVPVGIAADLAAILRTVSQGEAKLLNDNNKNKFNELSPNTYNSLHQWITQGSVSSPTGEYVGYYWDVADVNYTQKASNYYYQNDGYPGGYNTPHNPQEDGEAYWDVTYVNNTGTRFFNVNERSTVNLGITPEWNSGNTTSNPVEALYTMGRYTNHIKAYNQYVTTLSDNTSSFTQKSSSIRSNQFGFRFDYWGDWINLGGYWMDNDDGSGTPYDDEDEMPTWGWRDLNPGDQSNMDDIYNDNGHPNDLDDEVSGHYSTTLGLSNANFDIWKSQYNQIQTKSEYVEDLQGTGGDDIGGFVRGRNELTDNIYQDWNDYQYHWISRYKPIYDGRVQLSYQWVSQEQDIYDGRPRYETRNIQVKDVSIRTDNKFRTENITASQGAINNYLITNGERQHGLMTADTIKLTAKSGISANVDVTTLENVNNTSSGNIDLTVDKKATTDVQATIANNNGNININSISGIRLLNVTALSAGNDIQITAGGNVTVDKLKAADQLTLNTNSVLTLDLEATDDLSAGTSMNISADSIISNNTNLIRANTLDVNTANGNLDLYTQVNNLSLEAGGRGNVSINNIATTLNLTSAKISDGNFTLNTSGALAATLVKLINNSQARTFNITSGGDMTFGEINAGLYGDYDAQGNLIASSQINLTSKNGVILAFNPNDGIADVVAQKITATSGKTINFETATETNGLSATANTGDILIERISADDAKTLVLGDLIALQGNVKVVTAGNLIANTRIESATYGSIELVSKTANVIVTTSTTNLSDKLLKSNTLKLRATQQIIIDKDITLEGTTLLELAYGKTGIVQGSVQLPKIKTNELTLELGSGSMIVSPETFVDSTGKAIPLEKVNLIARGNQITEGQFVGYYRYRDVNSNNNYYLDTAELVQGTKVYRQSGNNLVALTAAEINSLRLAPVLNTISYQLIEEMSGRYVFSGNNSREYYIDGYELGKGGDRKNLNEIPNGTTVYTRQNDAGLYAYTVVDPNETQKDANGNDIVVGYKVVYSTESDYKKFTAQNPQYKDVQIKFTAVNNYQYLNLQAKMQQELAGGIQLVTPSGILQEQRTGFPIVAGSITLKAQRDLGNISFKDIKGTNVGISSGADILFIDTPTAQNLSLASTGYFNTQGELIGGRLTTAAGVTLTADKLELMALKEINVSTNADQLTAIATTGNVTIKEVDSVTLSNVSVQQGSLNLSAGDTVQVGKVIATNQVNLTARQVNSLSNDEVADLTAQSLTIKAIAGVGTDTQLLETSVKTVNMTAGTSVNLSNYGELTVTGVTAGGGVQLETHSPLNIVGDINAGDKIRLQSGDSQFAGDDLTINAAIRTIQGNITLNSGDNLMIASTAVIETAGEITIQGDFNNKDFGIGSTITLSGTLKSIGVKINTGNDSDIINIDGSIINYSATGILTTIIRSQNGNDIINLGNKNKTLNNIAGSIDINTSDDFDTLNIENSGNPLNNNLKVTVDRISGLAGMTGDISYLKVEKININLGSGNNLLNIASDITAEVNVNSGQGQNTILMDYANKTEAFDLVLDNGKIAGFTGAGNLEYTNFQAINVRLGTGNDKFTIKDTSFTQKISVDAGAGYNQLIVDVADETKSRNESIKITQSNVFGIGLDTRFQYSGMKEIDVQLGSGADNIKLVNDFTGKLNFNTGIGADTLVLEKTLGITNIATQEGADMVFIKTISAATSVDTGAGDDYIEIANNNNTVDSIAALLTVSGGEGQDYLTVNDSSDSDNSTLTLTNSTIRGLDLTAGINYSQLEMLDVLMGSGSDTVIVESTHQGISYISTGAGSDTVNVESISGETSVKLGAGNDTVNVGNINQLVDNISAALIVSGGMGIDSLNIDDSGDITNNTAILNDTLITGFGMNGEINYGNFESLDIIMGSGSDILSIESTHQQLTYIDTGAGDDTVNVENISGETNVKLGIGNDTVNVGNLNQLVDDISATLIVSGGTGNNTLNIDDSGDTKDNTAILNDTLVTGFGMNGEINYGNFENLNINLGSGSDILSIESTHQQLTYIDTGAGDDTVNVENISGETNVKLGVGNDTVNVGNLNQLVNDISATLIVSGGTGSNTLNIDDSGDKKDNTVIINDTLVTGFSMNGEINYNDIENLSILLGSGADLVTIESISVDTNIDTGLGEDFITLDDLSLLSARLIVDEERKN
ncbi:DUF4347 domain-containing protein [uncultured Nostoc sp.]|uniref:DUF4347 domain-containing protein n=1 Tax=uncultured Nostoc sp. TaxID=340711 RepID=UPI0035CA04C6